MAEGLPRFHACILGSKLALGRRGTEHKADSRPFFKHSPTHNPSVSLKNQNLFELLTVPCCEFLVGALFRDIEITVSHVLLKQGQSLEGTFSPSFYTFISSFFLFFFFSGVVAGFFWGVGFVGFTEHLTTCKI